MPISAPTVGLSFGSFGDIVAVLQLAWELRAALDESAGASAELRALVSDIDAFTRALQDVQANIERRRRTFRPDVVNGIAAALSRCRNVLGVIQQRIERARGQTSSSGWQKYWGTTAWSILGGKKDVEALRARLSEQLGVMQLYLSLCEANSQERVQDVLAAQDTTLQRLCSFMQDIQLRFDVGVPVFRFYDSSTNEYFLPLARTSLQRLRDVHDALRPSADQEDMITFLSRFNGITMDDFTHRTELSTPASLRLNIDGRDDTIGYLAECFFFREAAFGEWQVLVSARGLRPKQSEALKTLLERRHTPGADCNCAVSCSRRYRGYVEALVQSRDLCKLYSEVVALILNRLRPDRVDTWWLGRLVGTFFACPDLEQLRSTVLPQLRQQQLAMDDMVSLVLKAAPFATWDGNVLWRFGEDFFTLTVYGAALVSLLVGHAVPVFDELDHPVRLPNWVYFRFTGDDPDWTKGFIHIPKRIESSTMDGSAVDGRDTDSRLSAGSRARGINSE